MGDSIHILVAIADYSTRANLEVLLASNGHMVVASASSAEEAYLLFLETNPDLVISNMSFNSPADGIRMISRVKRISDVPVVFLTTTQIEEHMRMAREISPHSFITDPSDSEVIGRQVELAYAFSEQKKQNLSMTGDFDTSTNYFFTKIGNRLKKIPLNEICYIEVEGKYCAISMSAKKYHVKISLKELLTKLPGEQFIRVSRNHVINIDHIDDIDMSEYSVKIGKIEIPISRTYKEDLLSRITLI